MAANQEIVNSAYYVYVSALINHSYSFGIKVFLDLMPPFLSNFKMMAEPFLSP